MASPSVAFATARPTAAAVVPGRAPRRMATAPPPPPPPVEPFRKNPLSCSLDCPHFQSCSGCTHESNLDRPHVLHEVERFFEGNGVKDFSFHSEKLWEWRCRAKLAVRGSPDEPFVGLYQEGIHNVVDIPPCKAYHPRVNDAVDLLKRGVGELRYVQVRDAINFIFNSGRCLYAFRSTR